MTKVAIISFYSGLVARGVETWAENLDRQLGGQVDIEIIGGEKFGKNINWESKNPFYWAVLPLKLAVSTRKRWQSADVIIPTNGTFQTLYCRLVTLITRRPMVIFGHSGPGRDDKWNLWCSPNVFVAFSDAQADWAGRFKFPWTRIVRIYHAVDTSRFTEAKSKPKGKIVLCVAADIPSKRVSLVRSAVATLSGYKYVGIGQGNDKTVSHSDIPKVYRDADVFCFTPESYEAFGLVFLEALASGLPVVTIDDKVRREIVGEAGIFVKDPINTKVLAESIEKAYKTNWGDKPRNQAMKFDWKVIRGQYKELFNSL